MIKTLSQLGMSVLCNPDYTSLTLSRVLVTTATFLSCMLSLLTVPLTLASYVYHVGALLVAVVYFWMTVTCYRPSVFGYFCEIVLLYFWTHRVLLTFSLSGASIALRSTSLVVFILALVSFITLPRSRYDGRGQPLYFCDDGAESRSS